MRNLVFAAVAAVGMAGAAPAGAVTPISGLAQLQTKAFVLDGANVDTDTSTSTWTGTPQNRIAFASSEVDANSATVYAGVSTYGSASGQWAADGASGRVDLEFGWALRNTADVGLLGASFNDLNPNWSYTFRADHDGLLIWEGQVLADRTVPGNDTFGLTGWDLLINGVTAIDLTDPSAPVPRTGDGDFALVGGQTYTLSLTNFSNIAGRQFAGPGGVDSYRGRLLGQFFWTILEEPSAPVPEPGAWLMMILGFSLAGASVRAARRRARPA